MSHYSNVTSNKSSLDRSLQKHASNLFDQSSMENFTSRILNQRQLSLTKRASNSSGTNGGLEDVSETQSIQLTSSGMSANSAENRAPAKLNLLQLTQTDFPDVCVKCEQCVNAIREAIQAQA